MTLPDDPRGSIWRKWDLHIHTPFSFNWKGQKLHSTSSQVEKESAFEQMLAQLNASETDVFAIMDYWTVDGYAGFRQYVRSKGPDALRKTVLPGVELRVEAPMKPRLNVHVVFSDMLSEQEIRGFLAMLRIEIPGAGSELPMQSSTFVQYARALDGGKTKECGKSHEQVKQSDADAELVGMMTAKVTRKSLFEALDAHKGKTIMLLAWDTHGGIQNLNWQEHAHEDAVLCKRADMFEARSPNDINLILGRRTEKNAHVITTFQQSICGPKAVISGSDAHKISDYGIFPAAKTTTWIKANPSFAGLKQVLCEPAERCYIGEQPELLRKVSSTPSQFLHCVEIAKVADSKLEDLWFQGTNVQLNPGLVAIIGNKGTGKSALADVIANLSGVPAPGMSFLTKDRFRQPRTGFASHFRGKVTWLDGHEVTRSLHEDPGLGEPTAVRYLTQGYFEQLCNSLADGERGQLQETLDSIVFSNVEQSSRGEFRSLAELVEYRTRPHHQEQDELRTQLAELNTKIASTEAQQTLSNVNALETRLRIRKDELKQHEAAKPLPVPKPGATPAVIEGNEVFAEAPVGANISQEEKTPLEVVQEEMAELKKQLDTLLAKGTSAKARLEKAQRASAQVEQLERSIKRQVESLSEALDDLGISLAKVFSFSIDRGPVGTVVAHLEQELSEVDAATARGAPLPSKLEDAQGREQELRLALDAAEQQYHDYVESLARYWNRHAELVGDTSAADSIRGLEERLRWIKEESGTVLESLRDERIQLARQIHDALAQRRRHLESLYEPTQQKFAKADPGVDLGIQLSVNVTSGWFSRRFLENINHGRKGAFYGAEAARQKIIELFEKYSLDVPSDVEAVLRELERMLTQPLRDEGRAVGEQLVQGTSVATVYDYVFGLEWLELSYGITFNGKALTALSPGERGVVLLAFYLLVDDATCPLIIDQPELNLDSESVVQLLVPCVKRIRQQRQVVLVTHSVNLAVVCDADQFIVASLDRAAGNKISYVTGGIENESINKAVINILEGTWPALDNRYPKYRRLEA